MNSLTYVTGKSFRDDLRIIMDADTPMQMCWLTATHADLGRWARPT